MNKEFEFLNIINKTLDDSSYLGNDCAYLDEYKLAISCDILIEDVHFKRRYMRASEIAKKAILSNISDILASGAKLKYLTIALSGQLDNDFIQEFYKSANELSKIYDFKIVSGDLTKSDKIVVAINVFGDYKNRNISKRNNAKEGYIAAVIGEFGSSAQGLFDLEKGLTDNYFINYHKTPKLYPEFSSLISKNAKYPYAMMDSSDGLVDCLSQISSKSGVKIEVKYDKIPKKTQNKDFVLYGGEDYSLVVCLDERDFIKFPFLIKIGECNKGCGVYIDNKKTDYKGYEHFE